MGNLKKGNVFLAGQSLPDSGYKGLLVMMAEYIGMTLFPEKISAVSLIGDSFLGKPPIIPDYIEMNKSELVQHKKDDIINRLDLRVAYATLSSRFPLTFWQFPDASISEQMVDDISSWLFRR